MNKTTNMYENVINPFRIICLHFYTTLNLSTGNKVKSIFYRVNKNGRGICVQFPLSLLKTIMQKLKNLFGLVRILPHNIVKHAPN